MGVLSDSVPVEVRGQAAGLVLFLLRSPGLGLGLSGQVIKTFLLTGPSCQPILNILKVLK